RRLASPRESDSQLPGPTAHRCRLPGELQALPGVRHARAVDAKNRNIAVEEVTHIEIFAIGTEHEALGKAADLKFVDLCHTLAVDAQDDDSPVAVVIPGPLRCIRAPEQRGDSDLPRGTNRKAFGGITHRHSIDDPWRLRFEINHADGVDMSV